MVRRGEAGLVMIHDERIAAELRCLMRFARGLSLREADVREAFEAAGWDAAAFSTGNFSHNRRRPVAQLSPVYFRSWFYEL